MNGELLTSAEHADGFKFYLNTRWKLRFEIETLQTAMDIISKALYAPDELGANDLKMFEGRSFKDVSKEAQSLYKLSEIKEEEFDEQKSEASKLFIGRKIALRRDRGEDVFKNFHSRIKNVPDNISGTIIKINDFYETGDFDVSTSLYTEQYPRKGLFITRQMRDLVDTEVHVRYNDKHSPIPLVSISYVS